MQNPIILYVHSHFHSQFTNIVNFMNGKFDQIYVCSIPPPGNVPENVICSGKYVEGNFEANGNITLQVIIKYLVNKNIRPSLILTHVGDGTGMYLNTVFPDVPTIGYTEWYYMGTSHSNLIKNSQIEREMNNCSICIAPTRNQKNQFPSHLRKKILVMHEGISTEFFNPTPRDENKIPIITYVSRGLEPMRGFFEFIDGICKVFASGRSVKVKIIGQDKYFYDDDEDPPKEKAIKKLGKYAKHVEFMGGVSRSEVRAILNQSDIHVYFTRNYALSWSLLEAMSMGCIILGSNTLPMQEIITPDNGVLVDYTDSNEISVEINKLLNKYKEDPDFIKNMKLKAKTTASGYSKHNGNIKWSVLMTSLIF